MNEDLVAVLRFLAILIAIVGPQILYYFACKRFWFGLSIPNPGRIEIVLLLYMAWILVVTLVLF